MASLSTPIQDGDDDAGTTGNLGEWVWTGSTHAMGWDSVNWGDKEYHYFRWPVTFSLSPPLIITAAYVEFTASDVPGPGIPPFDPGELSVRFFNEDANRTARDFQTDLYNLPWPPVGISIPWSPGASYGVNDKLPTSDIKQYVQSWVDRPGFANGQFFCVRIDPPGSSGNGVVQIDGYENPVAPQPAVLKIWYAQVVPPVITPGQPSAAIRVPKYPAEILPPTESVEEFASIPDEFITGAP